ncbi:MAG TPA: YidC/Oxa1 family membrane protein insertase [Actinomycetota bacterium]|nr:YidC/Oxa1 family membrane protein insertase [Actinomycetota bacterium]
MGFFEIFAGALSAFYAVIPSYGLAIILLTLFVRLLVIPLSIKQVRSQREMQRIMPEVKAIQKKFKGDRQKINEETMKLYKEHGVNPLGGCGPLLLQFPILIGLYYVIRRPLAYMGYQLKEGVTTRFPAPHDYAPRGGVTGLLGTIQHSRLANDLFEHTLAAVRFLGIRLDCSSSDALKKFDPSSVGQACGSGLLSALPYLFLVLVMGFTTYYMQKQLQATRGNQADQPGANQMQMMTRIMPVFFMFLGFSFPSGVVLYWITGNIWMIAQQQLILRVVPHEPTPAKKNGGGSGSGKALATKPAKGTPTKSDGDNGQRSPTRASKPHPSSKKKKKR